MAKKLRQIPEGVAHIQSTYNNTIICIADTQGNKLRQSSSGSFAKGSRKGTPYIAQKAAETVATQVMQGYGMKKLTVMLKGVAPSGDAAVGALYNAGLDVIAIIDKTGDPHNGCRRRKRRRT